MKAIVQRVSRARVTVAGAIVDEIAGGILVLLGVTHDDDNKDADYLVDKIVKLRIFDDGDGKMNLSLSKRRMAECSWFRSLPFTGTRGADGGPHS